MSIQRKLGTSSIPSALVLPLIGCCRALPRAVDWAQPPPSLPSDGVPKYNSVESDLLEVQMGLSGLLRENYA